MTLYAIDSSVWIEYFDGTSKGQLISQLIEKESLRTSILAMAEIADSFARDNRDCTELVEFVKSRSTIVQLSIPLSLRAAILKKSIRKQKPKFGLADAIHLATAEQERAILLTMDHDFQGTPNTKVV